MKRRQEQPAGSQLKLSKRASPCHANNQINSTALSQHQPTSRRLSRLASAIPSEDELQPENEADVAETEDHDSLNEVLAAFDLRDRGTVGCCYYVAV